MLISGTQAIESIQKQLTEHTFQQELKKRKINPGKIYESFRNQDLNKD